MGNIAYDQINNFFEENIDKFVLLFKIEYIKLVYDNFGENRMAVVKNPPTEKKSPEIKKAAPAPKKAEDIKFSVEGQPKQEEVKNEEVPVF